ncbi:hypothetical protein [Nonomuraea sp. NPDC050691]|uniref:hypothetical protein n=1 Tax=Nonomuraea sp. NPDC050691 TaxID=3155661 RepID=UPI0033ED6F9F
MRPWDAFAATEADVRAMVADPRWQDLPVPVRAQAIASRTLVTPDGDRWLFGAHARWHLHDPADGRWHPAPPPRGARVRPAEHAAAVLPARVIPRGPDFAAEPGSTQAFVGPDVPDHLTEQVRVLVRAAGRRSELDFPLTAFGEIFAADVPSTVAAVWGVVMWCAYAPAFDGNERLLTIFGEYLRRPLPGDEWVRWLPAPPLLDLVRLVAERQRAGRSREALRLTAIMADTAHILLSDTRFRPRALALLTMVEPALSRPGLDERATRRDDESVRQAWLERCPARLARALLPETDPETHFAHTVYDLVEALSFTSDPARAAATLLADLSDTRGLLPGRLDHRLRHAYAELAGAGLTGTSAAETTNPDGFEVLGPSQPLPGPPGRLGAPTGAWAPPRPPNATGAWSPDGPTGSWSPADATGAWTPADDADSTGAWAPGGPAAAPGLPGVRAEERHTGGSVHHMGSPGPHTGSPERHAGFPGPHPGAPGHAGSPGNDAGSSRPHTGAPDRVGELGRKGPGAFDRSGRPDRPGADDRDAWRTGERGGSGLFRRSGERGRSDAPQTGSTGRTGNTTQGGNTGPSENIGPGEDIGAPDTGARDTGPGGSPGAGDTGRGENTGAGNTDARDANARDTGKSDTDLRNAGPGGAGRGWSVSGRLPQIVGGRSVPDATGGEGTRSGRLKAAVARRMLSRMPRGAGPRRQRVTSGFEIEPPDRATAAAVLGAAYAAGLAWQAVSGARVPGRGFAGQAALVRRIVHERDDLPS